MANPQPVPFVQVSAELFDAIARFPFRANELRCLLAIIRHTYGGLNPGGVQGPNCKTRTLSYGYIAKYLGVHRSTVKEALGRLVEMNVIIKRHTGGRSYSWGVQKDYEKWCKVYGGTLHPNVRPNPTPVYGPTLQGVRPNPTSTSGNTSQPKDLQGPPYNQYYVLNTKTDKRGPDLASGQPSGWPEKLSEIPEHWRGSIKSPVAWLRAAVRAYPTVDVQGEIRKAVAWAEANPRKQKKNWGGFLMNWFKIAAQKEAGRSEPGLENPNWVPPEMRGET